MSPMLMAKANKRGLTRTHIPCCDLKAFDLVELEEEDEAASSRRGSKPMTTNSRNYEGSKRKSAMLGMNMTLRMVVVGSE